MMWEAARDYVLKGSNLILMGHSLKQLALMIRSNDLLPDNWIYIHDSKAKVGWIQNFRSWSPEMVPDKGAGLCWH